MTRGGAAPVWAECRECRHWRPRGGGNGECALGEPEAVLGECPARGPRTWRQDVAECFANRDEGGAARRRA